MKHSLNKNLMDQMKLFWLWQIICLLEVSYVNTFSLQFTNITCESTDKSLSKVDECYIGRVNQRTNYMTVRYTLMETFQKDIGLHLQLYIRSNGWKPFLYSLDIDVCRYWKLKYNAFAKLILGFMHGHNHSCPYTEKYMLIDKLMNTNVAKKIQGLPLGKGQYAFSFKWSWKNKTRIVSQVFFDILNT